MNPETFVRWAEEYFGKYNKMVKKEVIRKLSDNWTPDEILALRENALEKISTQYKTPPDVHFLSTCEIHMTRYMRIHDEAKERKQIAEEKARKAEREEYDKQRQKMITEQTDWSGPSDPIEPRTEIEKFFSMFNKKVKDKVDL